MAYSDIDSGKVLNKEGLLELCSQIKTEIANNSGGGSSYTAGDGIGIDANGVISAKNTYSSSYGINGVWSHWREKTNPAGGYMEKMTITSAEQAIDCLLKGLVIGLNSNTVIDIRRVIDTRPDDGNYSVIVFDLKTKKITNKKTVRASDNYQYTLSRFNQYVKLDNFVLLELINPSQATIQPSGLLPYFIIHTSPEYTTYNVAENLDEVMDTVNTRIPSAPSIDGTYKLISTVASGTPTYSWGTDSGGSGGGTTYTAGTGISIENGVISLNLANAEEGEF